MPRMRSAVFFFAAPTFALAALVLLAAPAPSSAAPPKPGKAEPKAAASMKLDLPVQRATLENGLRVVMNVDHASPTVAIAITYDVGSRDEEQGKSGFAHVFEHLMFGATKNLAEGEFETLVVGRGGFLTAITTVDRTAYYMVVPENELALGLWLEAERMKFLDVSKPSFDAEVKIIEEEHRLRVSNAPYGRAYYRVRDLAFQGIYPYSHPAPGLVEDLERAELGWVQAFHAAHYGPNTAVLGISGDFDTDMAMSLVHRYFDAIPKIQAKPFAAPAASAEQAGDRREVVEDPIARLPGLSYGFVMPELMSRERDALELAAILVGDGESARLPTKLVREEGVATEARAYVDTEQGRGPGLLRLDVRLAEKGTVADVEQKVGAALDELIGKPPSAAEMTGAKRRYETAFVMNLAWNRNRAIELSKYELFYGDARVLGREIERVNAVTAEDVQKAAAKYLAKGKRTIVETRPKASGGPMAEVSR